MDEVTQKKTIGSAIGSAIGAFFKKILGYLGKLFSDDPTVSSTRYIFVAASIVSLWLVIYKTLHTGLTPEDGQVVMGLCAGGGLPKVGSSVADAIGKALSARAPKE